MALGVFSKKYSKLECAQLCRCVPGRTVKKIQQIQIASMPHNQSFALLAAAQNQAAAAAATAAALGSYGKIMQVSAH